LLASQLLAHVHQNASQHVLATVVAAVSPKGVALGVLDDLGVAGGEQDLAKVVVLRELRPNRLPHDLDLDRFPVAAEFLLAIPPHPGRNHRRLGQANGLLVAGIQEFLGLKVMLRRRPELAVQPNRVRREVGEAAEVVGDAVELDDSLYSKSESLPIQFFPAVNMLRFRCEHCSIDFDGVPDNTGYEQARCPKCGLLCMTAAFLAAERRPIQFSLRTFLIVLIIASIVIACCLPIWNRHGGVDGQIHGHRIWEAWGHIH
jgi:hypothetical protein